MKPFPSNLSLEDRRTYRRWVGGMFLSYLVAVTVAIGITLTNGPASDLKASNETQVAHQKRDDRINGSFPSGQAHY